MISSYDEPWLEYGGVLIAGGSGPEATWRVFRAQSGVVETVETAPGVHPYPKAGPVPAPLCHVGQSFESNRRCCPASTTRTLALSWSVGSCRMNLSSLRGRGFKHRLLHPYDEFWDRRLGVRTFGFIPAVGTMRDEHWQGHYQATPYRDIFAVLRHARVGPGVVLSISVAAWAERSSLPASTVRLARSVSKLIPAWLRNAGAALTANGCSAAKSSSCALRHRRTHTVTPPWCSCFIRLGRGPCGKWSKASTQNWTSALVHSR